LVATLGVTTVALGWGGVQINPADVAAVVDGVLVNAVWAIGQMAARPRESRRAATGMDTEGWMDTERLIRDALADVAASREIPVLSKQDAAELTAAISRHEVQGALQALLAVRLTDAPELEAAQARQAVRLALSGSVPPLSGMPDRRVPQRRGQSLRGVPPPGFETAGTRYALQLSEYFDDKVCGLVAMLEGRVGLAGLAQVRAEAYNARIVALLGAIERQVTALADPGRDERDEAEFLERYRRQAHQRHGFLTPPDFDRRRRVPIDDIYVPTGIREDDRTERTRLTPPTQPDTLKVWDLVRRLDRTVLLGDPGGGKTTAANVLTDYFASDATRRIPFLVTLREYAANTPLDWSVTEYIEQNLKTLHQSHAPDGLVERLLLTGRAVVIFDGLDELLDTSRRRDVSERVEQFCSAYPLTLVLVTSRAVGYDEARLDDAQFTCYRLGGFGDEEVAEYARKWFASQEGVPAAEAEMNAKAFLAESANAKDLRANPLLLLLMCILYRGAGSLPGDRAGIYARCAELLLRKWDEQRDLYRKMDADHLVEPTLRYLAWWLFTHEDSKTAATERELITKTAEFLYERGYETQEEARSAAREFVEFCRGRMWVFSDAGTTADGEKLYGFTHRTFLEYFAAGNLAATSDTPEVLARALVEREGWQPGWSVVAELAIKIKCDASDRGADRIYAFFLDSKPELPESSDVIEFLIGCLDSTRPSPSTVRTLVIATLDLTLAAGGADVLAQLLNWRATNKQLIADEISNRITAMASSADAGTRTNGMLLLLEVIRFTEDEFHTRWSKEKVADYSAEISAELMSSSIFRTAALNAGIISLEQVLEIPGAFNSLMEEFEDGLDLPVGLIIPYPTQRFGNMGLPETGRDAASDAAVIGQYLVDHPRLPWMRGAIRRSGPKHDIYEYVRPQDELSGLGVAAISAIAIELSGAPRKIAFKLSVPAQFRQVFLDWAEGRADFVESIDEEPAGKAELRDRSG
jgi:NACHT domain